MQTTIAPEEIEKFSRIADEWWDLRGKFAPLHKINPLRVEYIKNQILGQQHATHNQQSLSGTRLLDIGCGGGLICEPMARLGAQVTGIDASEKNIQVASLHSKQSSLDIDYRNMTAEDLVVSQPASYDVVLALEIIEHVADISLFVTSVMQLVKPGGLVIFSTMNRTAKAYALAILGAEYILRWLPRGTHDWNKFVKPSELLSHIEKNGGELKHMTGMAINPLNFEWSLNERNVSVNYLLSAVRTE